MPTPLTSSSTTTSNPILLLKTPSPTPSTDAYTLALALTPTAPHNLFTPHYIPVLTHTLHPDALIKLLLSSDQRQSFFPYGALILTSQRAVAALRTALTSPPVQKDPVLLQKLRGLRLRLYVVGPATARAVQEEVVARWLPGCRVCGGARAGSGEVLARLMLGEFDGDGGDDDGGGGGGGGGRREGYTDDDDDGDDGDDDGGGGKEMGEGKGEGEGEGEDDGSKVREGGGGGGRGKRRRRTRRPVLFLTGEKRRDVLPKMLRDPPGSSEKWGKRGQNEEEELDQGMKDRKPIQVDEMVVYQSAELEEFPFTFEQMLSRTEPPPGGVRWVVVFSPMAGRGMMKGLRWLDEGTGKVRKDLYEGRTTFVACIGPTTRAYLWEEFGFDADVVAGSPSPDGLRDAIVGFMREKGYVSQKEGRIV